MPRPHFLGTEASPSPLVPELLDTAKKLAAAGLTAGTVSARYGQRAVVNAAGVPLDGLTEAHFVEVADYDPHTDQVLCLGPHAPAPPAGLHQLVYRAKREVGALVHVSLPDASRVPDAIPRVAEGKPTLDQAMAVLEKLRDADAVVMGDTDLLVAGDLPAAARARALALVRGEA